MHVLKKIPILLLFTSCSLFAPEREHKSLYYGSEKKNPAKGSEAILEIFEKDYKDSLKGCFDLESFATPYHVILDIDIKTKGRIGMIRLRDKKSFKMNKTVRDCLNHHRKMIKLPKDSTPQTIELDIRG